MENDDLEAMNGEDDLMLLHQSEEDEDADADEDEDHENESSSDLAFLNINEEYFRRYKKKAERGIEEIVRLEALEFLPAKALFRFKSVNKEWQNRISNPFLAHSQSVSFRRVSGLFCQIPGNLPFFVSLERPAYGVPDESLGFLPERVTLRASANGLLVCSSASEDRITGRTDYFVCNPATQEWKRLPPPSFYHGLISALGVAFEREPLSFTDHFSLVCAFLTPDSSYTHFETYSSKTDSWSESAALCSELSGEELSSDGQFFYDLVYWPTDAGIVLWYDPITEECGLLPLPPRSQYQGCFAAMGGELCYMRPSREEEEEEKEEPRLKFVMEVYGDMSMRLKQRIPLDLDALGLDGDEKMRALGCVSDDELLLAVGYRICGYHVKERKVEVISEHEGSNIDDMKFLPYVNSLILLPKQY